MRTRLSPLGRRVGKGALTTGVWAGVIALLLTGVVKTCTAVGSTVSSAIERARVREMQEAAANAPNSAPAPPPRPPPVRPDCHLRIEGDRVHVYNNEDSDVLAEGAVRVTLKPGESISMLPSRLGMPKGRAKLSVRTSTHSAEYSVDLDGREITRQP